MIYIGIPWAEFHALSYESVRTKMGVSGQERRYNRSHFVALFSVAKSICLVHQ